MAPQDLLLVNTQLVVNRIAPHPVALEHEIFRNRIRPLLEVGRRWGAGLRSRTRPLRSQVQERPRINPQRRAVIA